MSSEVLLKSQEIEELISVRDMNPNLKIKMWEFKLAWDASIGSEFDSIICFIFGERRQVYMLRCLLPMLQYSL